MIELLLNFGDNKTFEKLIFLSKVTANPTPFLGYFVPKHVQCGHVLVQYGPKHGIGDIYGLKPLKLHSFLNIWLCKNTCTLLRVRAVREGPCGVFIFLNRKKGIVGKKNCNIINIY